MTEWRDAVWGDLATLEYGKSLRGYESGTGAVRVFGTNGPIGWHEEPLCNHAGVIIGRKGAYRGVHYSPAPFFVIDTAFYLEPKCDIDLHWAYYQLLTCGINDMDSGSAIPSTSREGFYALRVRVPPLTEQRVIAHILGTLDDKIELNRLMSETLAAMARAIFKAWFVDFGPVRAKVERRWRRGESLSGLRAELYDLFPNRLVESETGEIPEQWSSRRLDEVADFLNGLALQKYPPGNRGTLPVIKIAQLRSGNTERADRCSAALPEEYVIHDGDVLFSWSGSLDCVIWAGGKGALNQHLFKVSSRGYPQWFYYLWIHEHLAEFRSIASDKATTMGHIQRHHLSEANVVVADSRIMSEADRIISPIFERELQLRIESRTLSLLRDTLLPKLISGEIRVRDAERILGGRD